ncbi:MAG: ParA family protein, partial [Peptostreptococcaceae bacterium]
MKETKLISFFNIKGGIGKTTNTLLTAYELSEVKQDTKILLIDADIQGNLTQFIYNMNNDFNTIIDIVLDETLTADNIIIKSPNKNYRNIDLIPSNINLHLL